MSIPYKKMIKRTNLLSIVAPRRKAWAVILLQGLWALGRGPRMTVKGSCPNLYIALRRTIRAKQIDSGRSYLTGHCFLVFLDNPYNLSLIHCERKHYRPKIGNYFSKSRRN